MSNPMHSIRRYGNYLYIHHGNLLEAESAWRTNPFQIRWSGIRNAAPGAAPRMLWNPRYPRSKQGFMEKLRITNYLLAISVLPLAE